MGRTYHKADFWQREKIYELRSKGVAGAEVARLLAKGWPQLDPPVAPVKLTPQAVNSLYRQMKLERNALYFEQLGAVPTEGILELNRRKLSQIAAAELERLRVLQVDGKLNGDDLRKMAGACERIEKMEKNAALRDPVPDPPSQNPADDADQEADKKPPSFADSLLDEAAKREAEAAANPDAEPISVPEPSHAVPADPTPTGHQAT